MIIADVFFLDETYCVLFKTKVSILNNELVLIFDECASALDNDRFRI